MNIALIMAAGKGIRLGADTPKQFLPLGNKKVIEYSLEAFNSCEEIDSIIIVAHPDYFDVIDKITRKFNKVKGVIEGGESRSESVFNGLKYLYFNIKDSDIVLIHDAARPFVNSAIIKNNIAECMVSGAVDTVLRENNSIIRSLDNSNVSNCENRDEIYQSQTPQTFKFGVIYESYLKVENELEKFTDDISIAVNNNVKVSIVNGYKLNFKITTPEDLKMAEALVK